MTMTREQAANELVDAYSHLLHEAEILPSDGRDGLKGPIDDALRDLGYVELDSAEVATGDVQAFLAIARYDTLQRIVAVLARKGAESESGAFSSPVYRQAKELLDEARLAAERHGLGGGYWSGGSIGFDFLEPAPALAMEE